MNTKTSSLTPYQQIEYLVENGVNVNLDISYEDSRFIVSISATSRLNPKSFMSANLMDAIMEAYKYYVELTYDE